MKIVGKDLHSDINTVCISITFGAKFFNINKVWMCSYFYWQFMLFMVLSGKLSRVQDMYHWWSSLRQNVLLPRVASWVLGLWYALDSCYYIFQKPSETLKIIKLSFSYKNVMLFNGRMFYIRSSDLNLLDSKKDVANKDTSLVLSKFRV